MRMIIMKCQILYSTLSRKFHTTLRTLQFFRLQNSFHMHCYIGTMNSQRELNRNHKIRRINLHLDHRIFSALDRDCENEREVFRGIVETFDTAQSWCISISAISALRCDIQVMQWRTRWCSPELPETHIWDMILIYGRCCRKMVDSWNHTRGMNGLSSRWMWIMWGEDTWINPVHPLLVVRCGFSSLLNLRTSEHHGNWKLHMSWFLIWKLGICESRNFHCQGKPLHSFSFPGVFLQGNAVYIRGPLAKEGGP